MTDKETAISKIKNFRSDLILLDELYRQHVSKYSPAEIQQTLVKARILCEIIEAGGYDKCFQGAE